MPENEETILFERHSLDSNQGASSSSSATTSLQASAATSKSLKPGQQAQVDGVFGNLTAKPG